VKTALLLAVLAVAAAVAPLAWTGPPLIDVRQRPYPLHAGALQPGEPVGQRMIAGSNGVWGIDVHLAPLGPEPPGVVELRVLDDERNTLRRAQTDAAELSPDGWLPFEFEPLDGVAGRALTLELNALQEEVRLTPHLRYRGRVATGYRGVQHSWGDRGLRKHRHVRPLFSSAPDLAGLAIPLDDLDAGVGAPRALLLDEDGRSVRDVTARDFGRTRSGYRLFTFEPLEGSRHLTMQLVLEDPAPGSVVGYEDGPGYATLHRRGPGRATPLSGAVLHGEAREDVDLVVRVHAEGAPSALERALDALGGRAIVALALLALGAIALGRAATELAASDRDR
jgi:hypothetical protein